MIFLIVDGDTDEVIVIVREVCNIDLGICYRLFDRDFCGRQEFNPLIDGVEVGCDLRP